MSYAMHPYAPNSATQNTQNELLRQQRAKPRKHTQVSRVPILSILSMFFGGCWVWL